MQNDFNVYLRYILDIGLMNSISQTQGSTAGYSTAYRLIEAGERMQLKDEIRRSEHREHSYIAHRDILHQLLNDSSIFINRIQYENFERLIDYTDSMDIIKTAHFRKDGSIRITDDQRISTMADARNKKGVKWQQVR